MHRLNKIAFYLGDRFKGPRNRRRRSKFNHQNGYRRRDLFFGRVNVSLGGDYFQPPRSEAVW